MNLLPRHVGPLAGPAGPLEMLGAEVRELDGIGMRYALAVPRGWRPERLVVAVHGVSRNWRDLAASFVGPCLEIGAALVVPRFSRKGYRGYQRLEYGSRKVPADRALDHVLEDVARRLGLTEIERVGMFGFSGGAQFAHRYTLLRPERVRRQVLTAAGFYTFPETDTPYPYGLADDTGGLGPWRLEGYSTPTLVLVGEQDTERDAQLRSNRRLDRLQGRDRVQRARRYVLAVRTAVGSSRGAPECRLELLQNSDHDFLRCVRNADLASRSLRFLFPEADVPCEGETS